MIGQIITPRAREWLRHSRVCRVLHLFTDIVNLVNEREEVLTLSTPSIPPGPFTLTLTTRPDFVPNDPLTVTFDKQTEHAKIGPHCIKLNKTNDWNPIPRWELLANTASMSGQPAPHLSLELQQFLSHLVQGVKTNDQTAVLAAVYQLAGRGPGLTPAGDDILMGVLYGLHVWPGAGQWIEPIKETAVPRTTTLAAAYLQAAAAGEATRHWHDLINGRSGALAALLAIGHSSGRDAWAGFQAIGSQFKTK